MPYRCHKTAQIDSLIQELDNYHFFLQHSPLPAERRSLLRRASQLKSSLFSAKIEGNSLTLFQVEHGTLNSRDQEKIEVNNLLKALELVFSERAPEKLDQSFIQELHQITMNGLASDAGRFRTETTAIFNQAGVAVYLTPSPEEIAPQLTALFDSMQDRSEYHPYVQAVMGHYWFEKIHPFVDGNGRVGRLLLQYWLDRGASHFNGLLNFEEQIEKTRSDYYYFLQQDSMDLTEFVEYLLLQLVAAGEVSVESVKNQPESLRPEELLLPRRQEILALLRDHQMLTFDQIQRRFFEVSPSTLRYDLRQLIQADLVIKLGSTRGALYRAR